MIRGPANVPGGVCTRMLSPWRSPLNRRLNETDDGMSSFRDNDDDYDDYDDYDGDDDDDSNDGKQRRQTRASSNE